MFQVNWCCSVGRQQCTGIKYRTGEGACGSRTCVIELCVVNEIEGGGG
jgi:hypothetical protein